MRVVVVSGWGFASSALLRFCEEASRLDSVSEVTVVDPTHGVNERRWSLLQPVEQALLQSSSETVLVGWSMGGMLSVEALVEGVSEVCGLVLISTSWSFARSETFPWGIPPAEIRALRRAVLKDPGEALRKFHEMCFAPDEITSPPLHHAQELEMAMLGEGLRYLEGVNLLKVLPAIQVPVSVVHGGMDAIIQPRAGEDLARRISNCRFTLVEHAAHALPLSHPAEVVQELRALITEVSR